MSEWWSLLGLGLAGSVLILLTRQTIPTMAFCLSMALALCFLYKTVPYLSEAVTRISFLFDTEEIGGLYGLMLKGIGITYAVELTAQMLVGAGETMASKAVILLGKVALCVLAIEPAGRIIEAAEALLS